MSVYTTKELLEILPHRQPMLLIDTLEELEPGKRAVGKKCVSYNEPYFAGHFPGEPVMPGVLIVEALAQVGAAVMLSCPEFKGKLVYFGGIEHCRIPQKSGAGRCADAGSGNDPPERAPWSWKSYGYGGWKDSGDSRADLCHWIRRIPCFRKY